MVAYFIIGFVWVTCALWFDQGRLFQPSSSSKAHILALFTYPQQGSRYSAVLGPNVKFEVPVYP